MKINKAAKLDLISTTIYSGIWISSNFSSYNSKAKYWSNKIYDVKTENDLEKLSKELLDYCGSRDYSDYRDLIPGVYGENIATKKVTSDLLVLEEIFEYNRKEAKKKNRKIQT